MCNQETDHMRHLTYLALTTLLAGGFVPAAMAQTATTITFESGYTANTNLNGQDQWKYIPLTQLSNPADFQPRSQVGKNMVLDARTSGLTEYARPIGAVTGKVELRWRWKTDSADARLNLGLANVATSTNNNHRAFAVRVLLDRSAWSVKGATWATLTNAPAVEYDTWHYMRLAVDPVAGTYSLWIDTARDRSSETLLVKNGALAFKTGIDRIMLKADQGNGNVLVDDLQVLPGYPLTSGIQGFPYYIARAEQGLGVIELNSTGTLTELPSYTEGELVTLTARPAAGWSFLRWADDLYGVQNPRTIAMTRSYDEARAIFSQGAYSSNLIRNGTFSSTSGWQLQKRAEIAQGTLRAIVDELGSFDGCASAVRTDVSYTAGQKVAVDFDLSARPGHAFSVNPYFYVVIGGSVDSASLQFVRTLTPGRVHLEFLVPVSGNVTQIAWCDEPVVIDNLSVKRWTE
jgi:hypothetical protein